MPASFFERLARTTAAGVIVFTMACDSPTAKPPQSPTEQGRGIESPVKRDLGKEFLLHSLSELPESPIKEALSNRIVPLFQVPPPKSIDIAGNTIPVWNVTVKQEIGSPDEVGGRVDPRANNIQVPIVELKSDIIIKFPYIGLAKLDEMNRFEKAQDETPVILVSAKAGDKFFEGLSPEITLTSPNTQGMPAQDKKVYDTFRQFVAVKEAATLWLYLTWKEAVFIKMQELGFPTHVEVLKEDDSVVQVEIVNSTMHVLNDMGGRSVAAVDIAGAVLALKALEGTTVVDLLVRHDSTFAELVPVVKGIDIGKTPQEMMLKAFEIAMTNPKAKLLPHVGNIDRVP